MAHRYFVAIINRFMTVMTNKCNMSEFFRPVALVLTLTQELW